MPHLYVPNVLVRPYLEEYLLNYETGNAYYNKSKGNLRKDGYYSESQYQMAAVPYSAIDILAAESGVHTRQIWKIRNRDTNVMFRTADKLFTAMDMPYIWYEDPKLYEFYTLLGEMPKDASPRAKPFK